MTCREKLVVGVLLVALTISPMVTAHEDLHDQIETITQKIAQQPDAELYLRRAELHRLHRDWALSRNDYERARELDPNLGTVDLAMARMLLESGRPEAALRSIDLFLKRERTSVKGRVTKARVLVRLARHEEAAGEYTHAIQELLGSKNPRPAHYFQRARALVAAGDQYIDEAIRGLDEGIATLGPVVILERLAIDLERKKKDYVAALSRLETILARSPRKETWLARRGEILEEAGRPVAARSAYEKALEALESLPESRRNNRAMNTLRTRLLGRLETLNKASTGMNGNGQKP